jgi:8-oxo-dGTP pyrophosphatase MutT (NUDIX family)
VDLAAAEQAAQCRQFGESNMASKQSAGVLLYRRRDDNWQVLLVHPGGPYWKAKDLGAWSIPKGEFEPAEDPLESAKQEFAEETGLVIAAPSSDSTVLWPLDAIAPELDSPA